jgi:phosphatidylserine decarboxylase
MRPDSGNRDGHLAKLAFVPIHREGWRFVALFALGSAILFWIATPLGWLGVVLTLWCAYFFRDPKRVTPTRAGLVVSPADGVVLPIVQAAPPPELEMGPEPRTRVSVFMNLFDVHVNRVPHDGRVVKRAYRPGKFVNASFDKASEDNERMALRLALDPGPDGRELALVQIAGLVARRILCEAQEGAALKVGERFGMIRFGSRVDTYLPPGLAPLVIAGQRVVGGETVIADFRAQETAREGEVR